MSTELERLESALLETGMMNQTFIDWIRTGQVDAEYVAAALSNFRRAMHPPKPEVKDRYVLGFVFSQACDRVLLIWKNRPAWQKDKLNGIGGKIEAGETPKQAMEREFTEETMFVGWSKSELFELHATDKIDWQLVGRRHREATVDRQDGSYEMFVFAGFLPDVRMAVYDGLWKYTEDFATHWDLTTSEEPNKEEVIALPLNREILSRRGVPGLAWTVDIALQGLRENFYFDVEDPMNYGEDE
jgi:8-oxo-dGTP pyrophosphatase MutT (NUDIX family)